MKLHSGNKFRDSLMLMTLMICNMIGLWLTAIGFTTFPIMICLVPVFFSTSGMMLMVAMLVAVDEYCQDKERCQVNKDRELTGEILAALRVNVLRGELPDTLLPIIDEWLLKMMAIPTEEGES